MNEPNFIHMRFPAQDPIAVLDYRIEFDEHIASLPDGVSIVGVSWAAVPIAGDASPLVVVAYANAPAFAYSDIRLSGGTLWSDYRVRGLVSYSDGELEPMSFNVQVGYT